MKTKIISILGHSPGPGAYKESKNSKNPDLGSSNIADKEHYIRINVKPYWVGFFKNDFHVKLATSISKHTDDYEFECWRPYLGCDKIYSKKIDGITQRVFPAKKLKVPFVNLEYSNLMINKLNDYIDNKKIIVHLQGYHDQALDYLLLKSKLDRVPVLATQRGMV